MIIGTGRNFDEYYYTIITTDSNSTLTIGDSYLVGSLSSYAVDIDNATHTITKRGTYGSRVGQ